MNERGSTKHAELHLATCLFKNNNFTVISKDSDFYQRALLYGHPPKLIWLRIGNCNRDILLQLITKYKEQIEDFSNNSDSILILA
jgi:predicted nuclease of predicted toxin-antitoxin system